LLERGKLLVFHCIGDGFLGSIDVGNGGSGCGGRQRREAGIAEEVQYFWLRRTGRQLIATPVPMRCLFREKAEMAERGAARREAQSPPTEGPVLRHFTSKTPPASVSLVGVKVAVGPPGLGRQRRAPKGLRLRTDEAQPTIAFQLAPIDTIEQLKILPVISNQHLRVAPLI